MTDLERLQKTFKYQANKKISLEDVTILANELLKVVWLVKVGGQEKTVYLSGWSFAFNNRADCLGICKPTEKLINISKKFFKNNEDKSMDWEDVVRHEIAHAIDVEIRGYSSHDSIWQIIAMQVGAEPKAKTNNFRRAQTKYIQYCPICGQEKGVSRVSKRHIACGKCCKDYNNGKYSSKYAFKYKLNPDF